jgi:hypothetical protein
MNIQLSTGKTAYISIEQYLACSDEEYNLLINDIIADDNGEFLQNPFSSFKSSNIIDIELPEIE